LTPPCCSDHNDEIQEPVNFARTPVSGFFYLKEFNNEVYCSKNGCRDDRFGASSAACASVNLHGEAGAEFTNLSASFGAGEPGMTFNTQWAHSDNDGDSVGLGMGYNFNLGPF
jgi:hypothetical protein